MGPTVRSGCANPHQGFDYEAPIGTEALAAGAGKVSINEADEGSYGRTITLETTNEDGEVRYAFYSHLESISIDDGAYVAEGDILGLTGASGNADESDPHLHFELRTSENPGGGMNGRVSPNEITDTDFYTQDSNANQTTTSVIKVTSEDVENATATFQNRDGTEDIVEF